MDPLLPDPAPDFTDPLGILRACHERMRRHCALLLRVCEHLAEHGQDQEAREAIRQLLRYFGESARHHHADEEQDLFPLLADDAELSGILQNLGAEHAELESSWVVLEGLLSGDPLQTLETLRDKAASFAAAYEWHIQTENARILPLAEQRLDATQIAALGRAMARRRGVTA